MTFVADAGVISSPSSTGDQQYPIDLSGEKPGVVFLLATGRTTPGQSNDLVSSFGVGITGGADSTIAGWVRNLGPGEQKSQIGGNRLTKFLDGSGGTTPRESARVLGGDFDVADEFELDWQNVLSSAYDYPYLAIGGTNLPETNVSLVTLTSPPSPQVVPYTGMGFQADVLIGWGQSGITQYHQTWGFAKGTQERCMGVQTVGSSSYDIAMTMRNNRLFALVTGDTLQESARVVSIDSDGFTLDWENAISTALNYNVVGIKGGNWHIFDGTAPASHPTNKIHTGFGFQPEGCIVFIGRQTSINTISTNTMAYGWGFYANGNNVSTGHHTGPGGTQVAKRIYKDDACVGLVDSLAVANVSAVSSDGLTLTFTGGDGSAYQYFGLAFGIVPPIEASATFSGTGNMTASAEVPTNIVVPSLLGNPAIPDDHTVVTIVVILPKGFEGNPAIGIHEVVTSCSPLLECFSPYHNKNNPLSDKDSSAFLPSITYCLLHRLPTISGLCDLGDVIDPTKREISPQFRQEPQSEDEKRTEERRKIALRRLGKDV